MVGLNKGKNFESSAQITTTQLEHHLQELGVFGKLFGSKDNAPIYLAGMLAFIALIGAIAIGVCATDTPARSDLIKALVGIVIAALSFIGGASGRPN